VIWWFYNLLFPVVFACLLPHFLLRMLRRGGYARDFGQRFGRYGAAEAARLDAPGRPIWIQAVSVGELAVALSFMAELRRRDPAVRFVLTTNTSTGHALALAKVRAPDVTLYFPMDVPGVVKRALRRIRPAAVVLIENELWPNLIRYARRQGIPTVLVNGRISEHSFRGYQKIKFITRRLLPEVHWFCVQTAADRDRLLALGAPADRLEVVGSAKYDLEATPPTAEVRARAALAAVGVRAGDPVWVGGSTWAGEEEALLDAYRAAKTRHPGLLLALVPRHAERRRRGAGGHPRTRTGRRPAQPVPRRRAAADDASRRAAGGHHRRTARLLRRGRSRLRGQEPDADRRAESHRARARRQAHPRGPAHGELRGSRARFPGGRRLGAGGGRGRTGRRR
jgi:3-deoxy-D-manno-octulosonic-acid transferase